MPYLDKGNTRVAILPAVVNVRQVSTTELNAGVNVTQRLTDAGLEPNVSTTTSRRTPWRSSLDLERPVRAQVGFTLRAYRETPNTTADVVWQLARFRSRAVLVIRRGVDTATAWTNGQRIEVYRFEFGKRTHVGTGATMFQVPLFVYGMEDEAVVG